jgi:CheY-like chemotaxis protein
MDSEEIKQGENPDTLDVDERLVEQYAASLYEASPPMGKLSKSLWETHVENIKRKIAQGRRRQRNTPDDISGREYLSRKKEVLFIEDDKYVRDDYSETIENQGIKVKLARTADQALRIAERFRHFDAVVIDIRMHHGKAFSSRQTVLGLRTGVELAKELIYHLPDAVFIALTNSQDAGDEAWFEAQEGFGFAYKPSNPPKVFARYLRRKILREKPRVFIVHGHDLQSAFDLKDYLQKVLEFDEPVILQEKPEKGRTIIEKLEHYADESDIVFALFTPDDVIGSENQARARQNVLFEFGFFLGRFGRKSGKVIFLSKRGVEIPSDLSGLLPIDISDGIGAASEAIRRELQEFIE